MSSYYYAQNNQRHGPVPGARLKELAAAGQLARTDQICREGETKWVVAEQVKGLFVEEPVAVAEAPPAAAPDQLRPAVGPRFHYRHDGQQSGPVALAELKELAAEGRLHAPDFVWQEGTKNWVPAARVDGVFAGRRCLANGVSFLHPPDWTVSVKAFEPARSVLMYTLEDDKFTILLYVVPAQISPEEQMKTMRESLQGNEKMKNFKWTKSVSAIGGEKAEGFEFTCSAMSQQFTGRIYATRVGNHTVMIVWQAIDFQRVLPIADLLRASLTIEEEQEATPEPERAAPGGIRGVVGSGVDAAMAAYRKGKK